MLIDIIAGARPNFMKIAPIIRALDSRRAAGGPLRYRLVHTGQHYDPEMASAFEAGIGFPPPDHQLTSGGGTRGRKPPPPRAGEGWGGGPRCLNIKLRPSS